MPPSTHGGARQSRQRIPSRERLRSGWNCKGIQYGAGLTKKQLLEIGSRVKPGFISYRVNTVAHKASFIVLRLPRCQCEFNPVEQIWAQVKNALAATNTTFNIKHVEQLLDENVAAVTAEHWQEAVRHVETLEAKF
ncbi:hypothetical protein HPB48_008043 [Haemaphysalis longicornis]|uniref:Tc1-like transposase DDE domain-containing protein n=1 Tax=Haemaphysalis longicornis TaxID=44386 RepID=A0A9J6G002_HAELO|nr:hypothetical protein HPB48_008043 [Haemaphysalis longicornis]